MIYAFIILTFVLLIVIEIFTVLFRMTGLSEHRSRFQVISMITGVGYTTKESESILNNRLRRNIAQTIILLGYTSSATLISIFVNLYTHQVTVKETLTIVIYSLVILIFLRVKFIKLAFDRLIERIANYFLNKQHRNKLHTIGQYNENILAEITIINNVPSVGKPISELTFDEDGIKFINLEHKGINITKPGIEQSLDINDKILVFGNIDKIRQLFGTF